MDDFDTAHKQPRPLRARGGPAHPHPTLAKGTAPSALPLPRNAHVSPPRSHPRSQRLCRWAAARAASLAPKPNKWPQRNPNVTNKQHRA
jgi:hypothetical protein